MTTEAEPDLTAEEKAQIRALLKLIQRAGSTPVDERRESGVRPLAVPTPEDFAEYRAKRRRRQQRHG